ncbi:hypothetical protein SUGI_0604760 [Cryptomeria japonica]|nr:hypothetical protein SUGI_0604760 [Cryptomeria japonica]
MDSWYRARCPFLQGVNLPFGVPYLRRNVVPGSDASNASEVIRITNHVRRNVVSPTYPTPTKEFLSLIT